MTICSLTPLKVATAKKRKKSYIIRDRKLRGFHLKVYPSGRKTYHITYCCGGRQYNERIGNVAVMTTIDARKIAAEKINGVILMREISQTRVSSPTSLLEASFSAIATVNGHSKVRHLKRLKLNCLKDDTAKPAGEMLLQIANSSAGFAGASTY